MAKRLASNRRKWDRLRQEALDAYGRSCAVCGEDDEDMLQLDHVDDNGAEHRRAHGGTHGLLGDLKRRGWPPELQTLCANHNVKKQRERERRERGLTPGKLG